MQKTGRKSVLRQSLLLCLIFLAENREMNVSFWVCLEVVYKAVSTLDGMIQVIVEARIFHQQTQGALGVLYLVHHAMDACQRRVDAVHRSLQVDLVQLIRHSDCVLAHLVESGGQLGYIL